SPKGGTAQPDTCSNAPQFRGITIWPVLSRRTKAPLPTSRVPPEAFLRILGGIKNTMSQISTRKSPKKLRLGYIQGTRLGLLSVWSSLFLILDIKSCKFFAPPDRDINCSSSSHVGSRTSSRYTTGFFKCVNRNSPRINSAAWPVIISSNT